ncbi:MAG: hypothetical protein U1E50_18905 [Caulobacteraceae bacterium]
MRTFLALAACVFLAACNVGFENKTAENKTPAPDAMADVESRVEAPKYTPPPKPPTLVGGPQDVFVAGEDRGGIARSLGDENTPLEDLLVGRWAYNCNTGVGELIFYRGGRFKAPGGEGRYREKDYKITFTFKDGQTEVWSLNMSPGHLSMDNPTNGIDRVACSEQP